MLHRPIKVEARTLAPPFDLWKDEGNRSRKQEIGLKL